MGPANDQGAQLIPSAVQLAVNQTMQFQVLIENDSNAGINRAVGPGATLVATCGSSDCGAITSQNGVATGTGVYASQNQRIYSYQAPASIPTGGTVTLTLSYTVTDGRVATLGNNRVLTATSTITVVNSAPLHLVAVGPAASDLQIQPSYGPDSFGNLRQFQMVFNAVPNFTSTSTTWSVDGIVGGNATVGTITTQGTFGLYTSPQTTGSHTITAAASGNTTGSSMIAVSKLAPIVAFDLKANTVKNGWELKCGSRVLLENSLAELGWGSQGNGGGQPGTMMLMQPINAASQTIDGSGVSVGYGPEHINDITVRYFKGVHFGGGMVIVPLNQALGTHRVSVTNVLGDDVNYQRWGNGFLKIMTAMQTGGTASTNVLSWTSAIAPLADNISFRHNTLVGNVTNTFAIANNLAQFKVASFTWQDNFFASPGSSTFVNANGETNDCDTAAGSGSSNTEAKALLSCFNGYIFNHLALLDNTAASSVFLSFPIWQPAATAVGFANYNSGNGGDYRLCKAANNPAASCSAASVFAAGQANQASDGTDLGADITGINAAESAVRSGVRTP